MRLEAFGIETDGAFVERLGFDHLVAGVVDVGQVDDRRHQVGVDHQRLAIGGRRLLHLPAIPIIEP